MRHNRSVLYIIFPMIFVGLSLFAGGITLWIWQDVKEDRFTDLANTASLLEKYYDLTFHQRELSMLSIGQRIHDIQGVEKETKRLAFANNALNLYDELLAFGYADTTGQILTLTGTSIGDNLPNLSQNPETKRSFEEAKKAKGIIIGEVYYFDAVKDWIIPIRVPLRNESGELLAVNTSAIAYGSMIGNLQSFNFNSAYRIQLVNDKYSTTQIYFPLELDKYDETLRSNADVLENFKVTFKEGGLTYFEALNPLENCQSIGVRTTSGSFNHSLTITVDKHILWSKFWVIFRVILAGYLLLTIVTVIAFQLALKKEKSHTADLQSERDYSKQVIEKAPVLILGSDEKGYCTFINPTASQISGYMKEEIIGTCFWNKIGVLNEQDRQLKLDDLQSGKTTSDEIMMITNHGEERVISWSTSELRHNEKSGKERIWFGTDITNRKIFEKELQAREANLKSLFESTNSIIGLFDTDKILIEYNQSFADYAKLTNDIELEKNMDILAKLSPPISEQFRVFHDRALKGEKFKETLEYPGPEGSLHFLFSYNPIYNNNEIVGISMFVEDISELKSSQNELEQYTKNLEGLVTERTKDLEKINSELKGSNTALEKSLKELQEAQDQLVHSEKMASLGVLSAGVGHEINNPLNYIKNGLAALTSELSNNKNEHKDKIDPFLKIINDGVKRASEIVKSLSHFSRKGVSMKENCDIGEIIDNCLVILHNKLKYDIEIIKDFSGDFFVTGSEGQLHQAILNILTNAEQAIDGSGQIKIETRVSENYGEISISDSGEGITKENLVKIGDPFFTTKPPGLGTGLGLSITYAIVKEHHGTVKVTSKPNKGTTFKVKLPLRKKYD